MLVWKHVDRNKMLGGASDVQLPRQAQARARERNDLIASRLSVIAAYDANSLKS